MFKREKHILARPRPFEFYTARELWTDRHIASGMLKYHLDDSTELASRNCAFIDRSVEWMVSRFAIGKGVRICDLGCGPGLYAIRFAQAGATVTGLDFSENSIRHARKAAADAGVEIGYIWGDYLRDELEGPFDLVTLIYCDYCALSPDQRQSLLGKISKILAEDGSFFLDVCSMRLFETTKETHRTEKYPDGGFWSPKPHYVRVYIFKYPRERLLLHKYRVIEPGRTRDIYNWIQCFDHESISNEFDAAGFEITDRFSNVAGDQWTLDGNEIAVVARKRSQPLPLDS